VGATTICATTSPPSAGFGDRSTQTLDDPALSDAIDEWFDGIE